jgi:hypothetical protein
MYCDNTDPLHAADPAHQNADHNDACNQIAVCRTHRLKPFTFSSIMTQRWFLIRQNFCWLLFLLFNRPANAFTFKAPTTRTPCCFLPSSRRKDVLSSRISPPTARKHVKTRLEASKANDRPEWPRKWMPEWLFTMRPRNQLLVALLLYVFHLQVLTQRALAFPFQLIPNNQGHFQSIGLDS